MRSIFLRVCEKCLPVFQNYDHKIVLPHFYETHCMPTDVLCVNLSGIGHLYSQDHYKYAPGCPLSVFAISF